MRQELNESLRKLKLIQSVKVTKVSKSILHFELCSKSSLKIVFEPTLQLSFLLFDALLLPRDLLESSKQKYLYFHKNITLVHILCLTLKSLI